jgi:hypothetical protein
MTKALQQAIERLKQAPAERQDALAALLLHELDEDERWAQSTAANSDKLRGFVEGVLEADRRGECEPLDPDQL